MAETKTTTPRRTRAATATTTTRKPAAIRKPAAAAEEAPTTTDVQKFAVKLDHDGDTKNYAKFTMPDGVPCKGTLYVPLGATEVRVLVIGANDTDSDDVK